MSPTRWRISLRPRTRVSGVESDAGTGSPAVRLILNTVEFVLDHTCALLGHPHWFCQGVFGRFACWYLGWRVDRDLPTQGW